MVGESVFIIRRRQVRPHLVTIGVQYVEKLNNNKKYNKIKVRFFCKES